MKVSVVTPVLNEVRVGRALDSVFGQRYDGEIESIVIDGNSTDGTHEVLARYQDRVSAYVSEPDAGIYDGMNKGIARATGDIVAILNADDRYADDQVLRDVADAFERHPDVDVCYGNIAYASDDGAVTRYWRVGRNRRLKWHFGWRPPHPAFFVRRSVYERYGTFVLDMPIAADYELQLRLLVQHRLRSLHIDRVLVHMAPGGATHRSAATIVRSNLDCGRAWRQQRLRGGLLVPVLKPAIALLQTFRRVKI